ncbi:MAG TPA: 4Fe-4S binding protein [Anaerolineales bacterium]|nr:4Fe-4S binding protein [Anaerolineales bacterium]
MRLRLPRIIQPSTRAFIAEGRRVPGYKLFDLLHGYIYGRWPYLYIGIGTGEHRLSPTFQKISKLFVQVFPTQPSTENSPPKNANQAFADSYHGKVVPLSAATQLVSIHEDIRLTDLERIIPYAKARDLILKNPDHIVVLECPCRSGRANPCLPLEVCLIVGEPFASFVAEHIPGRARWITSAEAVEILRAEDERGHPHHAFFKDAMHGRFYAICNCCSCCCGALQAHQRGTPMLAASGYQSSVDLDLCIGCGDCQEFCQFGALSLEDVWASVDEQICMGCGVCVSKCEQGALSLIRAESKGMPLEIYELMSAAIH